MKLKIDNESIAREFFENSFLIGIVAPIKDYQFSWYLNQRLGVNFRTNNSLEIQLLKKKRNYFFSVYDFADSNNATYHLLYNNQNDGEYLLPEFKHLDFLWLIKGEELDTATLKELLPSIRAIPAVQLVNEMSSDKIKHKQHLIL